MFSTNKRATVLLVGRSWRIEPLEGRVLLSASSIVQLPLLDTVVPLAVTANNHQLSPALVQQAYDLKNIIFTTAGQTTSANGAGETIAIVDAFGDPNIVSDLQTFDANFGITNNNASGQFVLTVDTPEGAVTTDTGWAEEETLDVEWAHAIAPEANILLVEAPTNTVQSLATAVVFAAQQPGVVAVSMSWGNAPEFSGETTFDKDFLTPSGHPGVTYVAASGDNAAPNYPSTSPNVIAVGGTTLTIDSSGNWVSESAWSGSGGGVSPIEKTNKPDVSYDGDPNTGYLIFDSLTNNGVSGWQVVGGTSAGTPQWAAIIALADQGRSLRSLNSLDGATQTLPDLRAMPSSDFNTVTGGGFTGLGSPVGEKIIDSLVGGGITSLSTSSNKLAFVQQPTGVTAGIAIAPSVTVDIENATGSVITTDSSNVTLSIHSGPGSLIGTLTVKAVNGVATFNNLVLDTSSSYTLTAADGSLASTTSASFTVSPAAASKLVFTQEPDNVMAGNAIAPAVAVAIEDKFGNVVTGNTSTITIGINSGSGALNGTAAISATAGVASFGNLSINTSGPYTLKATDGSLTAATTPSFTVSPAAAAKVVFSQQPSNVAAGSAIAPSVTVLVEDQFGNIVTTDSSSVTLSTNTGPGALSGITSVQVSGGVATFSDLLLNTAGTYTIRASDGGLANAVSNAITVATAAASQLVFVQGPSNSTAGNANSPAITVAVEDKFGNVVTTNTSTITLAANSGLGALGGTLTAQASAGVVTFGNVSITASGTYTLKATGASLTAAISPVFIVSPAAATKLVFAQPPSSATAGSPVSPAVIVDVEDQFGNLITTNGSSVALSINSGPGALNGIATVQAQNGIATFSDVLLNTAGAYTLSAASAGLTGATTASFNVATAPVSQLVFLQQPSSTTAGSAIAPAVTVELEDQFGNLVTGSPSAVTLAVNTGPGALSGTISAQSSNGIATFNNLNLTTTGNYTLKATDGAVASAPSGNVVVNPADATQLAFAQEPSDVVAGNSIGPAVTAVIEDQFGNVVSTDTSSVMLTVSSGPGPLGGTVTAQAVGGVATFNTLSLDLAANYTISATDAALTGASSTSFNVAPAAASQLGFAQPPVDMAAGPSPTIAIAVEDKFGNLITADTSTITLAATGPGALSGTTVATAAGGVATFAGVSITASGAYTLSATAAGMPGTTSTPFAVSAAAAAKLAFSTQPSNTTPNVAIAPAVAVAVEDQFGNVVTSDTSTVTIALASGLSATLSGTLSEPAVGGIANFADLSVNDSGAYTLGVTDGSLPAADSGGFVVGVGTAITGGAATHLVFAQQPGSLTAGSAMPGAFVVDIEDQNGQIVTTNNSRVTLSVFGGPHGSPMRGTATVTAVNGVATFSNTLLDLAGDYTIKASDGKLSAGTSNTVAVDPATPAKLVYIHPPASSIAGNSSGPAVVVELIDRFKNIVVNDNSNVALFIASGPGGATIGGTPTVAASNGTATFNNLILDTAGKYRLTASVQGVSITSKTITIAPSSAASVAFTQPAANVTAGAQFAARLKVTVTDAFGNAVANGTAVTLSINTGLGAIVGKPVATTHNGVATFTNVTFQTAGDYTLTATSGSASTQTGTFTVSPAAASRMIFIQAPIGTTASTPFDVQVQLLDKYGNVATNNSSTATATVGIHPHGAALTGTTSAPVSGGTADFTSLTLDTAGAYTLRFADGKLHVNSAAFTIV